MTEIIRWEYVTKSLGDPIKGHRSGSLQEFLDALGRERWELSSVIAGEREDLAIFKRPVYRSPFDNILFDAPPPISGAPVGVLHG